MPIGKKINMKNFHNKMKNTKFKIFDKDRKVFARQITTYKLDRENNISLVVYLDKANKTRDITEKEKIYCNNFDILQFTGLLDKQGKDVYEGDVVKWDDDGVTGYIEYMEETTEYIVDEWKKGQKKSNGHSLSAISEIEVIGNIYEDKELLK